ncbi:helix-turn-helix domain-containing protein [Rhodanobacter sp. C01]|uniref:helix-turn-helix domain-containing protein n=1 Tax=Rhodanobacter sp. C01 TaxID=1945856 RepID=UPI0009858585|nr:helix-turn-helix domain-containing protein [Rhodanobacter sp. C01]OOG48486.1 hypothetical protein B0E50_07680 [Rhodanobacter sp. C01]
MNSPDLMDFACTAVMLGLGALAAALTFSAAQARASRYLAAFFACLTIDSLVGLIQVGWHDALSAEAVRWLHAVNVPLAYLLGPSLYAYAVALTSPSTSFRAGRGSWHIAPYALALLLSLGNATFAFDQSPAGLLSLHIVYHAWVLQGVLYLAAAVQRTYRARPWLEQASADEVALRLTWLRRLLSLFGVIWTLVAIDRIPSIMGMQESPWLGIVLSCLTTVALFILAWFGLRQRTFVPAPLADLCASAEPDRSAPYARSALDAGQCAQMADELSKLMADQHLYTNSEFDLQALSKQSGWPPNYISQALNQGLGRNFFEFVNGFRIAAAERCLTDPTERRTILEIALACGFGSKSTFNAVFKRMTGRTPSACRRLAHLGSEATA